MFWQEALSQFTSWHHSPCLRGMKWTFVLTITYGKCGGLIYLVGLARLYLGWSTAGLVNGCSIGLRCVCVCVRVYTYIKLAVFFIVCTIAAVNCQKNKNTEEQEIENTKTKTQEARKQRKQNAQKLRNQTRKQKKKTYPHAHTQRSGCEFCGWIQTGGVRSWIRVGEVRNGMKKQQPHEQICRGYQLHTRAQVHLTCR